MRLHFSLRAVAHEQLPEEQRVHQRRLPGTAVPLRKLAALRRRERPRDLRREAQRRGRRSSVLSR